MGNMNVKKKLELISTQLLSIHAYVRDYHGVSAQEARALDTEASAICEQAAAIAAMARESMGNKSAAKLEAKVRKALGFTYA